MLTNVEVIQVVTDLIAKCHADEPQDLGKTIWESLTDPDAQARDLTMIAVVAVSLATVSMDYTGLGVEPLLEGLRFESTWDDLTSRLGTETRDTDE